MEQKKPFSALLREDVQTTALITEMYPADWDMDAVFRKSYEKFRQKSDVQSASDSAASEDIPQQRRILLHGSRWMTAACLMLSAGIAGCVAWMQMSVPEPSVTMQTDITTSTVPLEEVQPDQTAPSSATADAPQQTATEIHGEIPPGHDTVTPVQTTVSSPSETASVQTQPTDSPQQTADVPQFTGAGTGTSHTQTTSTSSTAQPPSPTDQNGVTPASTTSTTNPIPGAMGDDTTSEYPGGAPSYEPEPTESRWTVRDTGTEYVIIYEFEDHTQYPSPDFTVDLAGYTVFINRPNDYTITNSITNEAIGVTVGVTFSTGASTSGAYSQNRYHACVQKIIMAQEGSTEAYLLTGDTECMLIWFDGRYLCRLWVDAAHASELFRIAEAMITH